MDKTVSLHTSLDQRQIVNILKEQLDVYPSFFEMILTLNARYWKGSSPVCGAIDGANFKLRNRQGPGFSLIAQGKLVNAKSGTQIQLTFSKPILPYFFGNRYDKDRKIILSFLEEWLETKET